MSERWWERSWSWVGENRSLYVSWRLGFGILVHQFPGTWSTEVVVVLGIFAIEYRRWLTL